MPIFKDEIDALAAGSSIELREKLFCALEREREETGFSNFTIRKRYLYIRLLSVREGRNLIDTVKELVPRLLDSGDYRQVNMRGAVSDFPRILLITAQGNIQEGEDAIFSGPAIGCYRIASFLRFFGLETDVFDPDLEDEASLFRKIVRKGI